jgi:hypothetical protein
MRLPDKEIAQRLKDELALARYAQRIFSRKIG